MKATSCRCRLLTTAKNREIGINKMIRAGAHITSTETVLFELLKTAGSDKFKDIFKIIK